MAESNKTVFEWGWCGVCDIAYIKCPGCGNNTCNSGSNCDRCDEAHEYWQNAPYPTDDELQCLKDEADAEAERYRIEHPDQALMIELIFGERA